ncbi:hypothetical protein GRI62_01565 [Erythrobacter arachoides]|uniref:Uncharacterized protein n=1 Tax=Aurantiacibacter arachoides TaxID=1850444 RepID=A0A844ZW41_9SPHN|nr:hypothetical protein [Aurantiacibacter arachoides]GGD58280.1 hypothetical protein GCM10011411_17980 [Aurantiacibacter arachoides]
MAVRGASLAVLALLTLNACGETANDESDDLVVSAEEPIVIAEEPMVDPMPTETASGAEAVEGELPADDGDESGQPDDAPLSEGL